MTKEEDQLLQIMLQDRAAHKAAAAASDRGQAELPKKRVWTLERCQQLLEMEKDRVPRVDMAVTLRVTLNSVHGQLARLKQKG